MSVIAKVVSSAVVVGSRSCKVAQCRRFSTTICDNLYRHREELARRDEMKKLDVKTNQANINSPTISSLQYTSEITDPTIRNYTPQQGGWVATNPICLSHGYIWTPQFS